MHASGALVPGRAPHAVIDADGRSDVSPGEPEATVTLRRIYFSDGRHNHERSTILFFAPSGSEMAFIRGLTSASFGR
jgi:hypothetical protein